MTREHFEKLVQQALDALPDRYAEAIHNVAILVEDLPREQKARSGRRRPRSLPPPTRILGHFIGTPRTQKSVFDPVSGPDYVVLYQRNLEAVCRTERELKEQVLLTLMHELGHYFGLSEDELRDV